MPGKKTILFGGTFDPIHLGHTAVASAALESISAERIILIPAKLSPLKKSLPIASDRDRLNMIMLATSELEYFEISNYELIKPALSYTLDTIRYFRTELGPETEIFWLVGADTVDDLIHWYGIEELIDECNISVMYRAGCEVPDFKKYESEWGAGRVDKLRKNVIKTPLINISSTHIRRRIASKRPFEDMLHPAVADYIIKNNLYK